MTTPGEMSGLEPAGRFPGNETLSRVGGVDLYGPLVPNTPSLVAASALFPRRGAVVDDDGALRYRTSWS